jgi:hypothetical protein
MQRFVEDRALFGKMTPWKSLRYISRGKRSNAQRLNWERSFGPIQQWRYRGVPARWRLKLIEHFGAIVIDDAASKTLPPVKQKTLADICREKYLAPWGIS